MDSQINEYDVGNISDMLGNINFDIDSVQSIIKALGCTISYANFIEIADNDGSVALCKNDILNLIEMAQKKMAKIKKNIKELQSLKSLQKITYKGGK